jgi:hypothetical protein
LTIVDGVVFLFSSLQNFGVHLAFGPLDLYFSDPVWQAGVGEAVIGALLLVAAFRHRARVYWVAYLVSVLGIGFGLSSHRVVGAARDVHIILVPLAIIGLALVVSRQRGGLK